MPADDGRRVNANAATDFAAPDESTQATEQHAQHRRQSLPKAREEIDNASSEDGAQPGLKHPMIGSEMST
jgi:hypothetical protein